MLASYWGAGGAVAAAGVAGMLVGDFTFGSNLVNWVLLGAAAGIAARWLFGERGGGLIADTLIGVCGAGAGGFVYAHVTGERLTSFSLPSLLVAFLGAIVLLLLIGALRRGPG
ncbi:MAG: GlsB/YeaQ/YmgE family stress response membrane protein [Armatimonadetes bacterium]|nr:GlsB/YeaQ/YmgE family stress response membrane protein [Armatimonadota bacterium]